MLRTERFRVTETLSNKRPVAQFGESLLQLGLRVHHDRPVPGDRLFDWLAGHEEEANTLLAGLHEHVRAIVDRRLRVRQMDAAVDFELALRILRPDEPP